MDRYLQRSQPSTSREPLTSASPNSARKTQERPSKRVKVTVCKDSEDDEDEAASDVNVSPSKRKPKFGAFATSEALGNEDSWSHVTSIESSLPPVKIDKEAIEEYETFKASQAGEEDQDNTAASRLDKRNWVRGRSSIYVDAFNLALDTVLEEESHLFDDKEQSVFENWKGLSYEAQYLYVRLFLRKTASWHRIERLGYYSDISDVDLAISSLLEARTLPEQSPGAIENEIPPEMQTWALADSFSFADDSEVYIKAMDDAAPLLSLDELKALAKEAKVQGKNKGDLLKALCKMSAQQSGLLSLGLWRSGTHGSSSSGHSTPTREDTPSGQDSNRNNHFLGKILAITGPLIRLSEPIYKLFERVHLVFYRSTEWTEKSLTTIILAKISRKNFPEYIVCRSTNIFESRRYLLEFEHSMRREFEVDQILEFNGPPGEAGYRKVLDVFNSISSRWRNLLREEQRKEDQVYEFGEGGYLRRFNAAHAYTRIAHKAAYVLGRLHEYKEEHALLTELLEQHLFHPARRGAWYQRKALLEERYMWEADPQPLSKNTEAQKKHWQRIAVMTCEIALEDRDCHLIYHYDLQKRLLKLEKRLRVPRREQHDFGHVRLRQPEEHTVEGIQLIHSDDAKMRPSGRGTSTKTIWLDVQGDDPEAHVSVEAMCLSHYRQAGWKGYHSEGGILRTLFAYLFFDVLFVYVPNVFQTAYQTCPLDLHTDAFFPARASAINHRLVEIANGDALRILREVDARERERRTCVVGLNWDYDTDDLLELAACFDGGALAAVCKVMAQEYRARGAGVPDLVLWRPGKANEAEAEATDGESRVATGKAPELEKGEVMFAEVKSANDRLSDTQRLWIHVLTGAGVRVALCNAVAKEVRTLD